MAPARAAAGTALVAAALALALTAPSAAGAPIDPLGFTLPGNNKPNKARRAAAAAAKEDPKTAWPQAAGDPSTPILPPGAVLQFPPRVLPRSLALGARRRAVLVTDGASYLSSRTPFPFSLLVPREQPVPHAYIVSGNGSVLFDMEFKGRMALPYGIAEDPKDGRVAVTFYQSQKDSVEVWQPDLSWKLTYHDVSLKPSIPFFYGGHGEMWIPFTVADRFLEETDHVLQMYIYKKDGSREETFPRREWGAVKYPHTVRVDGAGRVWAAGLMTWAWDDGVHGPTLKDLNETFTPPVRIDVYGLNTDTATRDSPFIREQRHRWLEQNPGVNPSREMLASTNTKYALLRLASFNFPGVCSWPLFELTGDGHIVAGCYDQGTLVVLRSHRARGGNAAGGGDGGQARDAAMDLAAGAVLEEVARFERPFGITALGGIAMDPSRKAFVLLDRVRGRVYSAAWPLEAEGDVLRGDGEDRGVHDFRVVSGMAAQEGGAVGERGEPREL